MLYVNIFVLDLSSEKEFINLEMIVFLLYNYCSVCLLIGFWIRLDKDKLDREFYF